jgi:hypothetical protein
LPNCSEGMQQGRNTGESRANPASACQRQTLGQVTREDLRYVLWSRGKLDGPGSRIEALLSGSSPTPRRKRPGRHPGPRSCTPGESPNPTSSRDRYPPWDPHGLGLWLASKKRGPVMLTFSPLTGNPFTAGDVLGSLLASIAASHLPAHETSIPTAEYDQYATEAFNF